MVGRQPMERFHLERECSGRVETPSAFGQCVHVFPIGGSGRGGFRTGRVCRIVMATAQSPVAAPAPVAIKPCLYGLRRGGPAPMGMACDA
jgi:hypothetical protein